MSGATRGRLHVFLGAAPAVGKTYASLQAARLQVADHGVDVVIGLVETHGRAALATQLEGLEVVPPRRVSYRGRSFDELDLPTLLERHPHTVVVDELAHSNAPGVGHEKRWQDVDQLLEAGIDVICNLNVQHLASLSDEVEQITALAQHETVPDELVASAHRIDLVRVAPSLLRERVSAGEIFDAGSATTALAGFFTTGRLEALDALAQRWMVEHGRPEVLGGEQGDVTANAVAPSEHPVPESSNSSAPSRRLVVLLSGAPEGQRLLRRAAQLAEASGSELLGLRVREPSDPTVAEPTWLQSQRRLLTELGGRYAEVGAEDVARAVLQFAEAERASHLVLGASRRSRIYEWAHGSVVREAVRSSPDLEVHIVPAVVSGTRRRSEDEADPGQGPPRLKGGARRRIIQWHRSELPARRRLLAFLLALVAPALVAAALVPFRASVGLPGTLMVLLVAVILVAGVGGAGPAAVATAAGILLADYYLTHPLHSFRLDQLNQISALIAFAAIAGIVSVLVNVLTNEAIVGARRRAVADGLARLAADCVAAAGGPALVRIVDSLRRTLDLDGVAVLRAAGPEWQIEASSGEQFPLRPEEAASFVEVGDGLVLVLGGGRAVAEEADLVRSFLSEIRFEQERIQLERIRRLRPGAPDP